MYGTPKASHGKIIITDSQDKVELYSMDSYFQSIFKLNTEKTQTLFQIKVHLHTVPIPGIEITTQGVYNLLSNDVYSSIYWEIHKSPGPDSVHGCTLFENYTATEIIPVLTHLFWQQSLSYQSFATILEASLHGPNRIQRYIILYH